MMMNDKLVKTSLVFAAALATALPALPALAGSSAASSASDSASTSVGSSSTSIEKSSASSTGDKKVAAGDYQLIEMAEAAGRPGLLRLRLQALAGERDEFFLLLPREAAQVGRLAEGKIVSAQQRPYGLEFAAADTRTTFFLVLEDGWQRELDSRPVLL
ncbi:hypothetical protein [Roseateles violae]|uniref:Uncharacterized protein n=1 Tax=Roseateles violae TaxID=3058042 RepID=A0ABT8DN76_9BURK|nr:hypothetical protein [Pelomonas sp. PFR6]MDN3919446.1 hypothetical protein [Pelomonas sp. PFR6]